jgi:signal transduction histidine kinase/DNA-binding response OmpR family regulator/ligand-binding sensor domain-containing protein
MGQTQQFFTSDKLSSNRVLAICQDKTGYIWVGTEYGLNKYDGYRFTNYLYESAQSYSISSNIVSFLFSDSQDNLWVGTQMGLDLYNRDKDQFEHVRLEGAKALPRINDMVQEDEEHLLVGTAGYGLYRLNIKTLKSEKLEGYAQIDKDYYSHIFLDSEGAFWKAGHGSSIERRVPTGKIQSFESPYGTVTSFAEYEGGVLMACIHGLLYYRDGQMYDHYFDMSEIGGNEQFFRTAITDRHDNLFVGTIGRGLCWIPRGEHKLRKYDYQSATFDLSTSNIWALFEDNQDNLWVGCQNRGLLMLPQQEPLFRSWKFADLHMATGGTLTSVCEGDNGIVWCAVQNNGIFGMDGKGRVIAHPASPEGTYLIYRDKAGGYWLGTNGALYAYNPLTGASQKKASFSNGFINAMTDDGKGHLIFSLFGEGFCCYDIATSELKKHSMRAEESPKGRLHNDWVAHLYSDSRGKIWICTASGINCYDPVEDHFHPYGWDVLLDYNAVQTVCETRDHHFLIGTITGLYIYDSKKKEAVPYEGAEVLSNKVVGAIVEDRSGDLWCSTTMGIWQYKRDEKKFVGYLHGNGLASREYVDGVVLHTAGDRIWFGFTDGLTSFVPEDLRHYRPSQKKVQLTGLYVGDTPVMGSDRFELSYIDNTFTMEFSLLNYSNAENVIYEYRLNGAKEWTRTAAGNNVVSFHHLQPGSYAMEVRAYDNGVYTEPQVYHIIIKAPWYQSSWAYLLYCALAAAIIGFIVWFYLRKRSQQLDEDKMKFLINATHDIRSPLTLIMSPLHKLLRKDLGEEVKEELKTIEHNASRIQNLVNQILDIRKIDKQQMKIHCQETDIVQYVGNILKSYEYTAHERGLSLTYKPAIDRLDVWLDRNQFDKVIDNLMSNAFKYTYDGGAIEVRVGQTDHSTAELKVIDNGMGIKGDLSKIFDRFYQGSTSRSLHIEGTGIGLNLCKMIMSMHHGHITAENRTDSSGSIFTVSLPLGNSHFTKEELEVVDPIIEKSPRTKPQTNYRILVVDDDEEIGKYIMSELGTYYRITAVTGAREALRYLLSANPDRQFDLVVSDVMMPEMDGFTFLRMVKTNMNISHVPVVMLTSKADVANRLEGLEKGADAYLAKPFDMDELHVVINNLISKSLHLKGKFSGAQQQKEKVVAKEVKGNDELLMERIMKAVNTHLSDSDFNVDMLTREVGISRAQLHRKMKELTGLPVSEFIRNIRLEQAVRLLKEQKINVTQVAYSVGFSNVAHFSTVFRKQFGVSPSEYIEQHHSAETN